MPQWSRRLRIVIDWTVALIFKNDVVQLDLDTDPLARHRSDGAIPPGDGRAGGAGHGAKPGDRPRVVERIES